MILQYKTNRWHLDEAKKIEITKIIFDTITEIANFKVTEDSVSRWNVGTDLSDLGVGPYHIKDIIKSFGYEEDSFSDNGWEMDYWFHFQHPDHKLFPPLCLSGTAIIHEMYLHGEDEDYETYEEREEKLKNDPELQNLIKQSMDIINETDKLLKEYDNE